MRQMLPDTRKITIGRITAKVTIQGDILGTKDSEKGARKVPFGAKQNTSCKQALQQHI
jgi:hypothetical protein